MVTGKLEDSVSHLIEAASDSEQSRTIFPNKATAQAVSAILELFSRADSEGSFCQILSESWLLDVLFDGSEEQARKYFQRYLRVRDQKEEKEPEPQAEKPSMEKPDEDPEAFVTLRKLRQIIFHIQNIAYNALMHYCPEFYEWAHKEAASQMSRWRSFISQGPSLPWASTLYWWILKLIKSGRFNKPLTFKEKAFGLHEGETIAWVIETYWIPEESYREAARRLREDEGHTVANQQYREEAARLLDLGGDLEGLLAGFLKPLPHQLPFLSETVEDESWKPGGRALRFFRKRNLVWPHGLNRSAASSCHERYVKQYGYRFLDD